MPIITSTTIQLGIAHCVVRPTYIFQENILEIFLWAMRSLVSTWGAGKAEHPDYLKLERKWRYGQDKLNGNFIIPYSGNMVLENGKYYIQEA